MTESKQGGFCKTKSNKVHEIITNQIIEQLKKNNLKWLKTWSLGFGCNYVTEKSYSGINAILINISLSLRGYKYNEWVTMNQIKSLKAKLNKGSKATQVIFFKINYVCSCGSKGCKKFETEESEEHMRRKIPILRYYNVFNIADTDLKSKAKEKEVIPLKEVEQKLNNYWELNNIKLGNPAYSPTMDIIYMPKIHNFEHRENYYSALTHELIHSTGHETRLKRKGVVNNNMFGSEDYAYEELVAELGSAFLCAKLGIEKDITNTSAYIKGWLKKLESDNTFIFKASAESKKAEELISECFEQEDKPLTKVVEVVTRRQEK